MESNTNKLLEQIKGSQSITEVFAENGEMFKDMSIGEYIDMEIKRHSMKKAKIIKDSGVNKRFFYDILAGNRTPNRRYIIRIFLAMQLELDDIQWYLKACDYPQLYAKNRRDCVIIFCIENKLPVDECNKMLNKIGLENLGFENI